MKKTIVLSETSDDTGSQPTLIYLGILAIILGLLYWGLLCTTNSAGRVLMDANQILSLTKKDSLEVGPYTLRRGDGAIDRIIPSKTTVWIDKILVLKSTWIGEGPFPSHDAAWQADGPWKADLPGMLSSERERLEGIAAQEQGQALDAARKKAAEGAATSSAAPAK